MFGINLLAIETVRGHREDSVHCIWVGEGDETKTTASLKINFDFNDETLSKLGFWLYLARTISKTTGISISGPENCRLMMRKSQRSYS